MATLACEGTHIRLTGVKSELGPFGDRCVVLHDVESGAGYAPLQNLAPDQAPADILNTQSDEITAFSLEYAYSLGFSDGLLIWQAHSCDFIDQWEDIIHQLIKRGQTEWGQRSSMVVLLPQGLGSGRYPDVIPWPRHWIQLVAQDHVQVCVPATPEQYFHLLRRQALAGSLKPLIIVIPDRGASLHPNNVSGLTHLANGRFRPILPDGYAFGETVRRIVICSGRIYHDLNMKRVEETRRDVAILRLQQIYPLSDGMIVEALSPYPDGAEIVWIQEEPENMGVWPYLSFQFGAYLQSKRRFSGVFHLCATGSGKKENVHYREWVESALTGRVELTEGSMPTWGSTARRDGSVINADVPPAANLNLVDPGVSSAIRQHGRYGAVRQT